MINLVRLISTTIKTMTTLNKYQSASRRLMSQAWDELERGDVQQASEKGWGAAAQIVKAVAEERGWGHRSHALLHQAVDRLEAERADDNIGRLFDVASSLHINFYENWNSATRVRRGLGDVERFVALLEPLIGG